MKSLQEAKQVHVIGIGGIGVSAIAKLLVKQGKIVTGSDATDSSIVQEANWAGVKTVIGNSEENIGTAEAVIYSEAVPEDDAERRGARVRGIPEYSGAAALRELTKDKRLIAIAGTNGKSTTTAMVGLMLEAGGFDPTVIVGTKVPSFPLGNVRVGKSDWFVLEADEYQAKFLQLSPEVAVVINIEEDHLDFYRDINHICETFQSFLKNVRSGGKIILNADDVHCVDDLVHERKPITFGIEAAADYAAQNISVREGRQWFTVQHDKKEIGEFSLCIPGKFNVMNALAAITAAREVGVEVEAIAATLETFLGIWRRFERVGERDGAIIVSDYGHHPTAIRGTIQAAREFYPGRRVVLVFQPHHHHRTKVLFHDFVKSFAGADVVILPEIYAVRGREQDTKQVSSEDLAKATREAGKVSEVHDGGTLEETEQLLETLIDSNDVVIMMGAGDIDLLARKLV